MQKNKTIVRSPLFYVGDKYKLVPQLLEVFPTEINTFFEPFTGGGSIGLNVNARRYVFNDINQNIAAIHAMLLRESKNSDIFFSTLEKVINDHGLSHSLSKDIVPSELRRAYKKTYYAKFNKPGYDLLREHYNESLERSPLILYLLLIYGFNRMIRFNSSGKFNVPVGNVDFNKNVYNAIHSYFAWAQKADISWNKLDCVDFLKNINPGVGDFVYLDPPYLISFSEYNKDWTETNEVSLLKQLDILNKQNSRFAISNMTHYKGRVNHIFLEWSKKYITHSIKSNYISYHDNSAKKIKEVLVTNYA